MGKIVMHRYEWEGHLAVRILIADDNPSMRAAIRLVLQDEGSWDLAEAASGQEVLDIVREQTFSLVILDLAMPDMDGISVARVLTEKYPGLPILMHTLYWSQRVAVEALKVGVRKVIPKSDKATILEAVREILAVGPSTAEQLAAPPEMTLPDTITTPPAATALADCTAENREKPPDSKTPDTSGPKA